MQGNQASLPKILLVDDEPRVLRSLKATLSNEYDIHTATDAITAQKMMRNNHDFKVIVSDERMPVIKGHELLSWAKKNFPDCVRVLISGYSDMQNLKDLIDDAGIFRFLPKPWDVENFKRALAEAILNDGNIAVANASQEYQPSIRGQHTIAVIDKNPDSAEIYQQAGSSHIKKILMLQDQNQLMTILKSEPDIGVLFMDSSTVEIEDALKLANQAYKTKPELVVVVVASPLDAGNYLKHLNDSNIFRFLIKPLTATRLAPMISAALEKSQDSAA